jgi:hypothetical protein
VMDDGEWKMVDGRSAFAERQINAQRPAPTDGQALKGMTGRRQPGLRFAAQLERQPRRSPYHRRGATLAGRLTQLVGGATIRAVGENLYQGTELKRTKGVLSWRRNYRN